MKLFRSICALTFLLGLAVPLQAQTCSASIPESTPTAEFTDHGDGTVTHSRTGLMWKRCAEGQTWSTGTCSIVLAGYATTWTDALLAARNSNFANHTDWRLPNFKELESIVEDKCYSPAINASIFPNTPPSLFWSASAAASGSGYVWSLYFTHGILSSLYKNFVGQVRLVRSGQSFAAFDALKTSAPICTLGANLTSVRKGGAATLTATCNPAAASFTWTGGTCAGTSASTCLVSPPATTTYAVTGTNGFGANTSAPVTVTVKKNDLTPILMLLLD